MLISRLASGICGLRVTRVYRSHGSMIHFHFGTLQEWYRRDGKTRYRGAYGLMVELADWAIDVNGRTLATSASWNNRIDSVLSRLLGKRVVRVELGERHSELRFEHGLVLALWPGVGWVGIHRLDNWTVFRRDAAALTLTRKGRLQSKFQTETRRKPEAG